MEKYQLRRAIRKHARLQTDFDLRTPGVTVGKAIDFLADGIYKNWPISEKTRLFEVERSPEYVFRFAALVGANTVSGAPKRIACAFNTTGEDLVHPPPQLAIGFTEDGKPIFEALQMRCYVDYDSVSDTLFIWHVRK